MGWGGGELDETADTKTTSSTHSPSFIRFCTQFSFRRRSENMADADAVEASWAYLPEPIFLHLAGFIDVGDVLSMSATCSSWNYQCQDDYLWKRLFRRDFKVDPSIGLRPGKVRHHRNAM